VADAPPPDVLVVGVGNALRGDDGAGLDVVRLIAPRAGQAGIGVAEMESDPTRLLELWDGCGATVVVDTMRSAARPGTVLRVDASSAALPVTLRGSSSTHAVGLGQAIELARALHRLPARVVIYAVEGECFEAGADRSQRVRKAVPVLAEQVLGEALALAAAVRSRSPARPSRRPG